MLSLGVFPQSYKMVHNENAFTYYALVEKYWYCFAETKINKVKAKGESFQISSSV